MTFTCPFCKDDMLIVSRDHFVSEGEFVTIYHCTTCRIGIKTRWNFFSLLDDEGAHI